MRINGKPFRTIWEKDINTIEIIDQRKLPHRFVIERLTNVDDFAAAIKDMYVRGAPLIGATAAYGMYCATLEASEKGFDQSIKDSANILISTRPTAVNLRWAIEKQLKAIETKDTIKDKRKIAIETARNIVEDDVAQCKKIGEFGCKLIEDIVKQKNGEKVNILTHCNAGWLATVDWGTATSPIYHAQQKGIGIHVYVDETRPRNQGAKLTAYEFGHEQVPHTIITDNAGGHVMQHGLVDIVIVGSDRTTFTGDVANKIGTYLKALAAYDNNIPFYVALPSSTIDWEIEDGVAGIPIEERNPDEVRYIDGLVDGEVKNVLVPPIDSPVANYAFDVTPARLVTGLITERGVCKASRESVFALFPEKK